MFELCGTTGKGNLIMTNLELPLINVIKGNKAWIRKFQYFLLFWFALFATFSLIAQQAGKAETRGNYRAKLGLLNFDVKQVLIQPCTQDWIQIFLKKKKKLIYALWT